MAREEIVGVTATGKYWSLSEPARPFLYQITNQPAAPGLCLAIRIRGAGEGIAPAITQEIHRLGPDLPAVRVQSEVERLRERLEPERAGAVLMSILGLAALSLAITGLYALLAQFVTQRTPELAVRMALGGSRASVAGMLLRQSTILVFTGTALGIAVSAAVARVLASISGQVNPLDGVTLTGVVALLAAVAAAATLAPAYRAVVIDPISALRAD
jgi:ABC-type antimicrobial peptide transport system permease subunit